MSLGPLLAIAAYLITLLVVGALAERASKRGGAAEYYLAGRGLGTVALFFALFGTNCSPFVLVGIPGQSYHDGIGIFSLNAPIIALGIPLTFWLIGKPARPMSQRLGALTPAELIAKRLDSRAVGIVLFVAFTLFTLPYMVTGIQGCGVALERQFDGAISRTTGAAITLGVTAIYTLQGGMRATAWTNVLQGALFLAVMVFTAVLLFIQLGGPEAAFSRVLEQRPDLLHLDRDAARFQPGAFVSYSLAITLTVVCFPHMLVRLMAARGDEAMRRSSRLYPIALVALWLPAVLIGVFGALDFPGLVGAQSDSIYSRMVGKHFPAAFPVLGTIAVLAAAMSTLDAQLLTLGSMLSRDLLRNQEDAERSVGKERAFLLLIGVATFGLYLWIERAGFSIFQIAQFAFSGYVMLFPTILLALRWRRFTATAALASIAGGIGALLSFTSGALPTFGLQPVAPALVIAFLIAWVTSRVTNSPAPERIALAFGTESVPAAATRR